MVKCYMFGLFTFSLWNYLFFHFCCLSRWVWVLFWLMWWSWLKYIIQTSIFNLFLLRARLCVLSHIQWQFLWSNLISSQISSKIQDATNQQKIHWNPKMQPQNCVKNKMLCLVTDIPLGDSAEPQQVWLEPQQHSIISWATIGWDV